jgi:hypothetical protein
MELGGNGPDLKPRWRRSGRLNRLALKRQLWGRVDIQAVEGRRGESLDSLFKGGIWIVCGV